MLVELWVPCSLFTHPSPNISSFLAPLSERKVIPVCIPRMTISISSLANNGPLIQAKVWRWRFTNREWFITYPEVTSNSTKCIKVALPWNMQEVKMAHDFHLPLLTSFQAGYRSCYPLASLISLHPPWTFLHFITLLGLPGGRSLKTSLGAKSRVLKTSRFALRVIYL